MQDPRPAKPANSHRPDLELSTGPRLSRRGSGLDHGSMPNRYPRTGNRAPEREATGSVRPGSSAGPPRRSRAGAPTGWARVLRLASSLRPRAALDRRSSSFCGSGSSSDRTRRPDPSPRPVRGQWPAPAPAPTPPDPRDSSAGSLARVRIPEPAPTLRAARGSRCDAPRGSARDFYPRPRHTGFLKPSRAFELDTGPRNRSLSPGEPAKSSRILADGKRSKRIPACKRRPSACVHP